MSFTWCQRRLAALWLIGGGLLAGLLMVQSTMGKFGDAIGDAWAWFVPAVVPTLTLILSALAVTARRRGDRATVDAGFYRISFWASAFYLVAVAAVPLVQPFTDRPTVDVMEQSKLWLGAIQGLVAIPLGVYFASGSEPPTL